MVVEKEEKATEAAKATNETEETKEAKEIKIPKNLKKLVEDIENLKVADLAALVKVLQEKFGVSPTPIFGVGAPVAPAGAPSAAVEEKKFVNVTLASPGDKKIEVIKAIRDITQLGLKDSKDLVDKSAEGPQIVKENVKAEEAEEMKKKLEAAGAKVELK